MITVSVEIKITQADIDEGEVQSPDKCAFNIAAQRAFSGQYVRTFTGKLYVIQEDTVVCFPLNQEATRWIRRYDSGREFASPASFVASNPTAYPIIRPGA